jgi:photosystem II stability/assembly factor-like uncharacterized protein
MRTLRSRVAYLRGTIAVLGMVTAPPLAQAAWVKQAPIPTGADLYAVSQLGPLEVWAVAEPGLAVHTKDGGRTWAVKALATDSLHAVFFLDAQRGWAAGNGFFRTIDAGQTWTKTSPWGSVYDLYFLDELRGWGAGNGGVTYRTTNGGLTWSYTALGTTTTLSSIWFADPEHGWTVDIDGRIYHSTNGGASWSLQHDAGEYLSTVQFLDAQEGWAIGGDTFLRTEDGGLNWFAVAVPPGTWSHAARFSDSQNGISVGEYGNVTRTTDGGQTWATVSPIGSGPRLWDVEAVSPVSSVYSGETGAVAMTRDGGKRWVSLQSGGTGATHAIDAVDPLRAWAANDGGEVLYTTNGGALWRRVVVNGFDNFGRILDVDFLDSALGWAVGRHEFFNGGTGRIVRSTNGGKSWQVQYSVDDAYMESVEAVDGQTVIAMGNVPLEPSFVLRSTDGGASWTDVAPSPALVMDSDFVGSTGWIVGGRIHKTTDAGQTWVEQAAPPDLLNSVSFADALRGWAVGWGPTILRTTDGGLTWTPQSVAGATSVLLAVQAIGPSEAWIGGFNGFVAHTVDGGQSWQVEPPPGSAGVSFEAMRFLDATRGWAGGLGIWRRTSAGIGADGPDPGVN